MNPPLKRVSEARPTGLAADPKRMPMMSEILRRAFRVLCAALVFLEKESERETRMSRGRKESLESRARSRKDRVKRVFAVPFIFAHAFLAKTMSSRDHYDSSRDDAATRSAGRRPANNRAGNNSDLSWKLKIDYCAEQMSLR